MNEQLPDVTARPPHRPALARRVTLVVIGMLGLGIVTGLLWLWLARPAEWEGTQNGLVLTEAAARGQFGVVALFVLIGSVASLVAGAAATWALRDIGWVITPLVVVLSSLAALVAWQVGIHLGPPDPATVGRVAVGDKVPSELAVDGVAPFLVWPIVGLVGVIAALWADRGRDDRR